MNSRLKFLAFYLPQFHPVPENDLWWGKGFTEWTNVRKARPLFRNHYQPHVPTDLGFYDLRDTEVQTKQANMAARYGVDGFCYWHYWFGNHKRLLEGPSQQLLDNGRPDIPYCFAWANQTWTGIWHGAADRILIKQEYPGPEDDAAHFYALLPHFRDSRYFRFKGKPVFAVYRPMEHPYLTEFLSHWQTLAQREGLGQFYFLGISYDPTWTAVGLDGTIFHDAFLSSKRKLNFLDKVIRKLSGNYPKDIISQYVYGCRRISYAKMIDETYNRPLADFVSPTIHTGWDNTPRSGSRGYVFHDFSPELFEQHVAKVLALICHREESLCFIKSWNEWAEGNYLEPDDRFGYKKLEALKSVIDRMA